MGMCCLWLTVSIVSLIYLKLVLIGRKVKVPVFAARKALLFAIVREFWWIKGYSKFSRQSNRPMVEYILLT